MMLALLLVLPLSALPRSASLGPGPKAPAAVRRVVTLAPSLTDVVLALGEGKRLVGVSRFDEQPEVAQLPRVGGFSDPSVEAVARLRPDLVLCSPGPGNRRAVETLAGMGVPVRLYPLEDVEGVLVALREVGALLGKGAEGEELAWGLEAARARVRAEAEGKPRPRVLVVYGVEPLVAAGPGRFADELLRDAGGLNVLAPPSGAWVTLPVERAMALKPDLVINAAEPDTGSAKLKTLPGLKEARWETVAGKELLYPGPRLAKGWETVRRMVAAVRPSDGQGVVKGE
jgi:iron complex transport system substrate-binding protein